MSSRLMVIDGERCLLLSDAGPAVSDARDLVEGAINERARVIIVPAGRFDASFFELRSGVAGEIFQEMVNYGLKLAVLGDISAHIEASEAFRDLVVEANRGGAVLFVPDLPALTDGLAALRKTSP